jgi:hypothetical protein
LDSIARASCIWLASKRLLLRCNTARGVSQGGQPGGPATSARALCDVAHALPRYTPTGTMPVLQRESAAAAALDAGTHARAAATHHSASHPSQSPDYILHPHWHHAAAQVGAPAGARAPLALLLLVLPGDDYGGKKTRRLRGVESDGIGASVLGVWGLESVLHCKFGTLEGGSCSVLKKQVIPTPLR